MKQGGIRLAQAQTKTHTDTHRHTQTHNTRTFFLSLSLSDSLTKHAKEKHEATVDRATANNPKCVCKRGEIHRAVLAKQIKHGAGKHVPLAEL